MHKLEIKTVEVPSWDELLPALLEGRGDLIAGGVTVTDKRRQQIDFTAEVFPTRHVVLTRKPHRVVRTVQELRQERVGTIKGTSMAEVVASVGVPAANVDDSFPSGGLPAALKENRFTACVDGLEEALVVQRQDPDLQIFSIPGFGKLIVDAVFNRDYAVVQGVVLVTATIYITLNLIADIAYILVNPRLRA